MKLSIKFALIICAGLTSASAGIASATPVSSASSIGSQLGDVSIFSNTYFVVGASSTIYGSTFSGAATTVGAQSKIDGDVITVAAATIGAGTVITGEVKSSGTFAQRATEASSKISEAQFKLSSMTSTNYLQAVAASDMTLYAGVYGAPSWTVAAGVTIMLDGQGLDNQSWVFNFTDFFVV